ncbi:uncharacterized protein LOC126842108 isoform X1 [Adelges cooleyi]|uniref:uncharacterized protein LOC126842108 isoform X1 n=1 Tax=Adelges cooleyi TaxID=133065 RepID=UPI0021804484|nr:uncharacterized protein LOC126842108 isoform X1 [Adelges cooleyi]
MSSQRIIGNAVQTKDSNDLCLTSGAIHETCKIKPNSIPCVTDVVQLQNQTKTRPQVPTVNEIVFLNKQNTKPTECVTLKAKEVSQRIVIESPVNQKARGDAKAIETKLFIEKQKKERAKKIQLDLLEKQKEIEERKTRLQQLHITTKMLAKASVKPKVADDQQDKCITRNRTPIRVSSPQKPELDQTWSPPKNISCAQKSVKTIQNAIGKSPLKSESKKMDFLMTKNAETLQSNSHKITNRSCLQKYKNYPVQRDVTKPEVLFSKLKYFENIDELINENTFVIPQMDLSETSIAEEKQNSERRIQAARIIQKCFRKYNERKKNLNFYTNKSDFHINSADILKLNPSTVSFVGSARNPNESVRLDEPLNLKANTSDTLSRKVCEGFTQTDVVSDKIFKFVSSKQQPPPMNFISVLKCKLRLKQIEQSQLDPVIHSLNEDKHIPTYTHNQTNNVESEYAVKANSSDHSDIPCDEDVDIKRCSSRNKDRNYLEKCKSIICDPDKKLEVKISLNKIKNKEKENLEQNHQSTKNIATITNEDIKHILEGFNFDFLNKNECSTKTDYNSCVNLKSNQNQSTPDNYSWRPFNDIHDEFQAELDTLNNLNESLCNIENMSCNTSFEFKETLQKVDNSVLERYSFPKKVKKLCVDSNIDSALTNLNILTSNMTNVDKTITGFSIQMFEQFIKDVELRVQQHHTILHLREKSLSNRLKWEITMCDLQMKYLKNRPGQEKQIQLLKQKQRSSVKKLEHAISQVKLLSKLIESLYKQQICMLEEQIRYLKVQSSSKKIIRKLKSLDHCSKKNETAHQKLNLDASNRCLNIKFQESDEVDMNLSDSSNALKQTKKMQPTEINEIQFSDQCCSPIFFESKHNVESIHVQTDIRWPMQIEDILNKSVQTSTVYSGNISENNEDLSKFICKNTSMILPKSNCDISADHHSDTSSSSDREELHFRIKTLKKTLEDKKLESNRLKKEQKKLKRESLKVIERELLREIEAYNKQIEDSKKKIVVEVERNNIEVIKCLSVCSASPDHSVLQRVLHNESKKSSNHSCSDEVVCPEVSEPFTKEPLLSNQQVCEAPNHVSAHSDENLDTYASSLESDCVLIKSVNQLSSQTPSSIQLEIQQQLLLKNNFANDKFLGVKNENPLTAECSTQTVEKIKDNIEQIDNFEPPLDLNAKVLIVDDLLVNRTEDSNCNNTVGAQRQLFNKQLTSNEIGVENKIETSYLSEVGDYGSKVIDEDLECLELSKNDTTIDESYSSDFTSDSSTSDIPLPEEPSNRNDKSTCVSDKESSYEEDRSEGDIIFEDKTFIEQHFDESKIPGEPHRTDGTLLPNTCEADNITNNILNGLVKETKRVLQENRNKASPYKKGGNDLNDLTDETPLLLTLQREREHQNYIVLNEHATVITATLFKRHFHSLISHTVGAYIVNLNEAQLERLFLYLKWFCNARKKLKPPEHLTRQHTTNNMENDDGLFEIYYQKYRKQQKKNQIGFATTDKYLNDPKEILSQTLQEAEQLKLEQMRIEEEIERLRMSDEDRFYLRQIPNKPPPPYKSPTKTTAMPAVDLPYTTEEVHQLVTIATSRLIDNVNATMPEDFISKNDSKQHVDQKMFVFDYCKEIAQSVFKTNEEPIPVWMKTGLKLNKFRVTPKSAKEFHDLVVQTMDRVVDVDDSEEKVNRFVAKQMYEENSKWTDFELDEVEIKNDVVQSLMKKLICDTIENMKTTFNVKFK